MAKEKKKTLVLLDSHAIIHRAYHALPDFSSSKGEPTGALYGLVLMLLRIIEEFRPDHILACFDLPKPTYRHEAYKEYKAGRRKADPALVAQLIRAREVFKHFHIPIYEKEGFEADDMLGTIVEKMKDRDDLEIVIASGDMDTMQLVEKDRVKVFTLRKGVKDTILYGEKQVLERFGFAPKFLPDYKGLRGDPSDNIIGIKGIGEKTATDLIKAFGTIEKMYEALEKSEESFRKKSGVSERIYALLRDGKEEAIFSKMLATIRRDAPIDVSLNDGHWTGEIDPSELKEFFRELEFRSLVSKVDEICGGESRTDSSEEEPTGESDETKEDEEEVKKMKIAAWLLDSNLSNPTYDDVLAVGRSTSFEEAKKNILKKIDDEGLTFIFEKVEAPLIPLLERMKEVGIKIDLEYLKDLSKKYHAELDSLEKEIWKYAGKEFNVSSPKQLGDVLFDDLKLTAKGLKKTAGGARSTKESELEKLRDAHPIVPCIFEYRELEKLLGTYIDAIPVLVKEDGRLHPTFIQTGAATGRMASKDPGVQNIPVKTERGFAIRRAFIAEKGNCLAAFDYSQIELRIAAILSGDEKLIEIFKSGEDVHSAVASQVFKVPLKDVTKDMRRKAKVINFGILYGMGVNALRGNLGSTRDEAQKFYTDYFETFSTLAEYLQKTKESAAKLGYTATLFGRRRYFEGFKSHLPFIRAAAERMAINAPIQGTQADIVKIAMLKIDEYLQKEKILEKARLLLQIHDELIYEVDEKILKSFSEKVKEIMEEAFEGKDTKGVPIIANASSGPNWCEMKPL